MNTLLSRLMFCLLFLYNIPAQSQNLDHPKPVKIVTKDFKTYRGMVIDITIDYIVLDLSKDKSIMVNTPYYLRPEGKYYRIDVEYIQTAFTKKRKAVGKAALVGAIGGMTILGGATYLGNNDSSEQFLETLKASAFGLIVGGMVGTIAGLFVHKKWAINGSSVELAAFRDYYF